MKTFVIIGHGNTGLGTLLAKTLRNREGDAIIISSRDISKSSIVDTDNKGNDIKFKLSDIVTEYIQTNKIKCLKCKTTIESLYKMHRVWCKCGKCSIDGGRTALIRKCNVPFKELSVLHVK